MTFLFFTSNYWNGIKYQRHFIAENLCARGHNVYFFEHAPIKFPEKIFKRLSEWVFKRGQGSSRLENKKPENLEIISRRWLPPVFLFSFINKIRIRKILKQLCLDPAETVLITYYPSEMIEEARDFLKPAVSAYISVHNYDAVNILPRARAAETRLLKDSHFLFADCEYLKKRAERITGRNDIKYAGPGVDYKNFDKAYRGDEAVRARRVCYYGRAGFYLDAAVYNRLAEAGYEVFIIGNIDPGVRPLLSDNIKTMGPVENCKLWEVLFDMDVLLLAYTDSDYMKGVIPAKIYECLATGKPLIVTGISSIDFMGEYVYFPEKGKDILDVIKKLPQTENANKIAERRNRGREAAWEKRTEELINNLGL